MNGQSKVLASVQAAAVVLSRLRSAATPNMPSRIDDMTNVEGSGTTDTDSATAIVKFALAVKNRDVPRRISRRLSRADYRVACVDSRKRPCDP